MEDYTPFGLNADQEQALELSVRGKSWLADFGLFPKSGVTEMHTFHDAQCELLKFLLYHELVRQGIIQEATRETNDSQHVGE